MIISCTCWITETGKRRICVILFDVKSESQVFYSEHNGRIYYLDPVSGNLSSVELIPEKEAFPLAFPEMNMETVSSI